MDTGLTSSPPIENQRERRGDIKNYAVFAVQMIRRIMMNLKRHSYKRALKKGFGRLKQYCDLFTKAFNYKDAIDLLLASKLFSARE